MAAYRFSAQVIGRSGGRSAVAAAAYRSGTEITRDETGQTHDFRQRGGVVHEEIMLPEGAPSWMADRARLWNVIETEIETRSNSQFAREVQLNIPHELDADARRELVRNFVQEQFVDRGMVADVAIHAPHDKGDTRNHHSHVMLTFREIDGETFASKKQRDWNKQQLLEQWRERWADHQNLALEQAGLDIRVDHRSLEARGIDREPEPKLGPVATQIERDGRSSNAGDDLRAVWKRNAEREWSQTQEIILDLQIAHERLSEARTAQERPAKQEYQFSALYEAERASLRKTTAECEQQVDELSGRIEGRNRIAVFWDKLRGRLGWNAELELEAKRQSLQEAQEREKALELSYARQRDDMANQAAEKENQRRAFEDELSQKRDNGLDLDGDHGMER